MCIRDSSLDLEKAYELVWKDRILYIMKNVGVTEYLLNFEINFLQNTEIRVRVNNILSDEFKIKNEVPQGSLLSATLFLIAINEISSVKSKPIQKCLFADDLTLF